MQSPSYLALHASGELLSRAAELERRLACCDICPWQCRVNRLAGEKKVCVAAHLPIVSSWAPHFGEEPALSGSHLGKGEARGTGNIFFGHCNLRCVYCQNHEISQDFRESAAGSEISHERLASIMLELQARGCHNLGLVSPTHFVPQILKALPIACDGGLRLPLVYNTNSYDNVDVLQLLDGVVDIYLPDLKYSGDDAAREYSKVPGYVAHSRAAVAEMYRQMGGTLVLDERGLLQRGLVIRLLVLPNDLAGLRETLEWIHAELSPRVTLSVMSQYYPAHKVNEQDYPLLARRLRPREYERVLGWLEELNFENGWLQPVEQGASSYYRPDFRDRERPFRDAADFMP
jgi:putative pyruvate formate lyase activating enzyme